MGGKPFLRDRCTKHGPASEKIEHTPVPQEPKGLCQCPAVFVQIVIGNGPRGCSGTQNAALGCLTHTELVGDSLQPML